MGLCVWGWGGILYMQQMWEINNDWTWLGFNWGQSIPVYLASAGHFHSVHRPWDLDALHLAIFAALLLHVLHDLLILVVIHQLLRHHHVHETQYFCGDPAHLVHWAVHQARDLQRHRRLVYTCLERTRRGSGEARDMGTEWEKELRQTDIKWDSSGLNLEHRQASFKRPNSRSLPLTLTRVAFLEPTLALCTRSFLSPSCMPFSPAMAWESEEH